MQTATNRRKVHRRAPLIAASAAIALIAAVASIYTIHLAPPGLTARDVQIAAATTGVAVDRMPAVVGNRNATRPDLEALTRRATLVANLAGSSGVRDQIARRMRIASDDIAVIVPLTAEAPLAFSEPGSEKRANEIADSRRPYRLYVSARPTVPILQVSALAPSIRSAEQLANASVAALRDYLDRLSTAREHGAARAVRLRQLSAPQGALTNPNVKLQLAGFTFIAVFGLALGIGLLLSRTPGRQAPLVLERAWTSLGPSGLGLGRVLDGRSTRLSAVAAHAGNWPRTTRLLPWLIAGFMAMLWLVPINSVTLNVSLPIDLQVDRIVIPVILVTWLVSLAVGGRNAPRLRLTWVHLGIAAFAAVALFGLVLEARELNQTLEFGLALKKLSLLTAYIMAFVIVASVVRRTEVNAFLALNLGLAVVVSLGILWEQRFHYNVFYDLTDKLLPGVFQVAKYDPTAVDEIGRLQPHGPAELGLEAVAMLAMALPIAIVGLMQSTASLRRRVIYGAAACLIFAAALSTYRKSAILAPVAAVLTVAYFRRDQLLRLAPLGLVVIAAVHVLSPGAFTSVLFQLHPSRLGVSTVSDRTADYDAVRPDLWAHMAFGRGYGSYEHTSHRILDSEFLLRVVETGLLGFVAYVLMALTVVYAARGAIAARDPIVTPGALAGAAAAVAFLTVSTFYDALAFPHGPYVFLCLAALVAVVAPPARGWVRGRGAPATAGGSRTLVVTGERSLGATSPSASARL